MIDIFFLEGDLISRMKTLSDYIPDDTIEHISDHMVSEYIYDRDDYPCDVFRIPIVSRDNLTHNNRGINLSKLCQPLVSMISMVVGAVG